MKIRPADATVTTGDHEPARFGGRDIELAHHKWLVKPLEHGRTAAHDHIVPTSGHLVTPAMVTATESQYNRSDRTSGSVSYSGDTLPLGLDVTKVHQSGLPLGH